MNSRAWRCIGAVADKMSGKELREHASQILQFVAANMLEVESSAQTEAKSHGHGVSGKDSASSIHGAMRYASGFTLLQLIAEYRALRASVLKQLQADGAARPPACSTTVSNRSACASSAAPRR